MTWNNKVVWSEGMFLQPQHFQQQDRYHEQLLENRISPLLGYQWGFRSIELNSNELTRGKIQIISAQGIFPDGTAFSFPNHDSPPLPLEIASDIRDEVIVLALPMQRIGTIEVEKNDDNHLARYSLEEIEVSDSNTLNPSSASLQIGQLRLRLMLKRDATNAFTVLGIVKITERRSDRQIVLHKEFIPPMFHVGSDLTLKGYLQDLCGRLHQCGEHLRSSINQPCHRGIAEISDFLMLQTVNRYESLFLHLDNAPLLHPERFYSLCLSMAGDLSTFNEKNFRRPPKYIEYQHDALELCFSNLMAELRVLLNLRSIPNAILIELQKSQHDIHKVLVPDKELFKNSIFVLAINAQIPAETIRLRLPDQLKAGPAEEISNLVNYSLPGIPLIPLPVAPRQLPFHAGFNYFELERKNDLWKQLGEHSIGLAMYIPSNLPGLELELWAIKE